MKRFHRITRLVHGLLGVAGMVLASVTTSGAADLVVRPASGAEATQVESLRKELDATVLQKLERHGVEVWQVPKSKVKEATETTQPAFDYIDLKTAPLSQLFVDAKQLDLLPEQGNALAAIRSDPSRLDTTLVRLEAAQFKQDLLKDAQSSIQIALPKDGAIDLAPQRIDSRSDGSFTWYGTAQAAGATTGTAALVVRDASVTGAVQVGTDVYSIRPLGGGMHAMSRLDPGKLPEEEPKSFHERAIRDREGAAHRDLNDAVAGPAEIDVLVVYTPALERKVADVPSLAELAIAWANRSYENSAVQVRLRGVGVERVDFVESDFDLDIDRLTKPGDGHLDGVHARRDALGADVVVLLVDNAQYCGIASEIDAPADRAFAIVHHSCAAEYLSFAHEIGHLQGARHDRCVDPTDSPYPYGHCIANGTWRTVMAYANCCNGCKRIPYWSNPDVSYQGVAMGTKERENNARVLNETAVRVSAYRSRVASAPAPATQASR